MQGTQAEFNTLPVMGESDGLSEHRLKDEWIVANLGKGQIELSVTLAALHGLRP